MEVQTAGDALVRPGQLLTDRSALSTVSRWTQAVAEADGFCVIHLSPGVDPCELTVDLRERGFRASPNHVLVGQPLFFGGPASRPFPADRIPLRHTRARSSATVALLDTGVAEHPWWKQSGWYGRLGREADDATEGEQAGHGTFIAGLLVRVAPGVELRVVRVLDGDGLGDEASVLRALHRMRGDPPAVVNLSFGCHSFDGKPPPLLADALGALTETVAVACAGNTASDRPFWPAALPGVVGVGAVDAALEGRAPFSSYGPWVDACARGEWLTSSYPGFDGYAAWSGTSFAAALVSGALAVRAGKSSAREAVKELLRAEGARQIPDLGILVTANL